MPGFLPALHHLFSSRHSNFFAEFHGPQITPITLSSSTLDPQDPLLSFVLIRPSLATFLSSARLSLSNTLFYNYNTILLAHLLYSFNYVTQSLHIIAGMGNPLRYPWVFLPTFYGFPNTLPTSTFHS